MSEERDDIVDDIISTWYELEDSYDYEDEVIDRETLAEYNDEQLANEWEIAKQLSRKKNRK